MKEQTKKFYLSIILSLIALFLISCDNKDKTGAEEVKKEEERTLSYYAGNWWGKASGETAEDNILTINGDSSITFKLGDEVIIPSSSVTRVSDTNYIGSYYTNITEGKVSTKLTFNFSSDTQGKLIMEVTLDLNSQSSTIDITKK
ncbi:hypothetical protein EPJ67_09800 [Brachyspira aalborgi]|uniref:Lipocalin-like domain-containing protein n=1 Tax=Brachyspira aalborgi TaxID=29522 RepID=A0A5C8G1Z8_9SPIR|nr:hypothetical protein [Brachyspira aalborgi]TXJ55845.1 hypothetical protein EPJ67_09800 [Brachyspira aalborgi]